MMASPRVFLTAPSASLFTFPPDSQPYPLPAPQAGSSLTAPPFSIPPALYSAVFDVRVPLTIASVYAVTVVAINRYNKSRGNKPWKISKTTGFFWFVVAHNVFLAAYSAWTCVGMFRALTRTLPGLNGPDGLPGLVDSLCKMHGTEGFGNAITYHPSAQSWVSDAPSKVLLTAAGTPDSTDLGRLWNEGLAFYGWFFYLSKFYEVLDTFIILAKGKRSSTLQTYHHSGAMMCMWAGMRFMAAPIWMFVLVNSGIHAMMYTYYTLTAFSIPIHRRIKRSLTTMQITQFLVGATYAMLHSFVSYTIPVPASSTSRYAPASPPASPPSGTALLKKILFRAAGEEGLAENIGAPQHHASNYAALQSTACITTSGQTFAIWLNVLYLAPLTVLFVRFFVRSYSRRTTKGGSKPNGVEKPHVAVEGASVDAWKGVERKLNGGLKINGAAIANGNGNGNGNGSLKARGAKN